MNQTESLLTGVSATEDPMDMDIDKVSRAFADLLKIPIISSAFLEESEHFLNVYTEWSFLDVVVKEKSALVKQYSILKSSLASGRPVVASTTALPYANVKLTQFSRDGTKRALVIEGEDKGNDNIGKEQFLRIYDSENLVKTFDLKKLDKHKEIYSSAQWGSCLTWSQDGTKLAYLAEKKIPKAEPFFPRSPADDKDPSKASRKGEEFAFRQGWGEQLNTCYESVIVILDVESEEFKILELPDKLSPSDLQWVNNTSIIGTGYVHYDWRLGLIYCTNRESRIFQIEIDGNHFRYLSSPGRAAMSPRLNPESSFLIWQEREPVGPHEKSREILGLKLNAQLEIPRTLYTINPSTMIPIYSDFPQNCWSQDCNKFFVVTPNELDNVLLEFNIASDFRLTGDPVATRGVQGIYSIGKDYIVASRSSCTESPAVLLINIETRKVIEIVKSARVVSRPVHSIPLQGLVSPYSFYYGPAGDDVPKKSVPLVVWPHGGPHAVCMDMFIPEFALYLNLGFGVVRLNYVGSLGGTKDVTESLCGKIGVADVQDCQAIVQSLISKEPSIDPEKIVFYGGSHAGFLGAHLTSSFPHVYKAAALINPVTDLLAMISTSDITDWVYVESGIKNNCKSYVPMVNSLEAAKKLMECSPIHQVAKVQAPTLLLLGSEDLRVPISQGLAYYRALLAAGKVAEVRLYNDCHPLGKVPSRFDETLHALRWFVRYLKK